MNSGFRLFINLVPVAILLMGASFFTIYPYRKEPAAKALIHYLILVTWLIVTNTAEMCAPTDFLTLTFAKLEYISYLYLPVTWLSFCLRYTGWITYANPKLLIPAIVIPAIFFLLVLTNDWHGLLWREVYFVRSEGFSVLRPVHGPLFWLLCAYSWSFLLIGSLLVFRSFVSEQKLFYRQSFWILAGALLPAIANLINLTKIIPGLKKDFTPLGFALSGVFFLAGIYLYRLFWVMPVARGVLLQELDIGILVLDDHGWIIDHNKKTDEMFGIKAISAGCHCEEFPALKDLLAAARFVPGMSQTIVKSGQMKWNDATLSWSIQTAGPSSREIIIIVEDISDQVRLEKEMNQIKQELINREKLATVGRLTAGLAHEINNPVGYLKSDIRSMETLFEKYSENSDRPEAKEIREICTGLSEGLEHIESVIRSLLSFSRQEAIDAKFEPYNLYTGIDTTLEIMKYEYGETIQIRKEYGEVPIIQALKTEINQVLLNLLTNAVHAIRERAAAEANYAGLIIIRTGRTGSAVWCEIENNGPPIKEENRKRVFDLFFTTKPETWGTGLGLNISRDIIEHRHGGKLLLKSIDPVIFRIELPA